MINYLPVRKPANPRGWVLIVTLAALLLGSGIANLWFCWQIYGIGGWRDEVEGLASAKGNRQAMEDFASGNLRLYVIEGENDRHRFSGTNDGPFQVWLAPLHEDLGRAHRFSTKQFTDLYNRKMRYMHSHGERFRKPTNRAELKER